MTQQGHWYPVLRPLMQAPGIWHRIETARNTLAATQLATRLRTGQTKIPGGDGEWLFSTRGMTVWAMWLSDAEEPGAFEKALRRLVREEVARALLNTAVEADFRPEARID